MPVAGRGRILVWEGASLWVLEGAGEHAQTDYHAHHAIQITLALAGDFELRSAGGESLTGPAVAVAPDASHIFRAEGRAAFLFVEPESAAGRALLAETFRGEALVRLPEGAIAAEVAALSRAFDSGADDKALIGLGRNLLTTLAGPAENPPPHPRVEAMRAYAIANLEAPLSLTAAAGAACLSPDRARHLFVEQTGLPFKTWVLWLRISRAVELFAGGASLTEAAHEAGFADSAHFSRNFRRTFGLPAASLRVNSRFVQAEQRAGA